MTTILPIERQHYEAMFELCKIAEPFKGPYYYDQFCQQMECRKGFTIWKEQGVLAGYCCFSDFMPGHAIVIHLAFHPKHRNISRRMLRMFSWFAFVELEVPRVVSFTIDKLTDEAGHFLKRVGFRQEGVLKQAARFPQGIYDIHLWAMLKEECRWL